MRKQLFFAMTLGVFVAMFTALFVNVSSAVACDPLECSKLSYSFGSPYCKGSSVYIKYKEYYCSGFDCIFKDTERLIGECKLGCLQGICITCNDAECRIKSGYVGSAFCKDNNVYMQYRDYQCKFEKGCVYEVLNRLIEDCVGDCRNGYCGCDPVDCIKRSSYYGDTFCKADNDVYREYRQYYCSGYSYDSRCVFDRTDAKIADCQYSCSSGECISLCRPDCTAKSGFYGDAYCKDGDVYRKQREYYCVSESCVYNEREAKVDDCKRLCKNAECVDALCTNRCDSWGDWTRKNNTYERTRTCYNYTSSGDTCLLQVSYNEVSTRNITIEEKTKEISFDIDAESISKDIVIDNPDTKIYNGLFFGMKDISIIAEGKILWIKFYIKDTNSLAPLVVSVDSGKIYRDTPTTGEHTIDVNRDGKRIKIATLSSGWQFWTASFYDIADIKIKTTVQSRKENEFDFSLGRELDGFEKASLSVPDNVTAIINDESVRIDSISRDSFGIENKIRFMPAENTKTAGKAILKIWYLEEK